MKRPGVLLAIILMLLLAAMALKGQLITLPDVRDQAEPGQFDTRRAIARLGRILGDQRAHPVDSAANDAVRTRLIAELRAIGLSPRVADDFVCNSSAASASVACARVRNVLATIGPPQGRHLLMVSHYDSTPSGPGASDDGIGVAVMLETAALLARRGLSRPVTFLFNEGEEAGLLGARAFLANNRLAGQVQTLINFESRGVTGPATMFETNSPNGAAIGHYARTATFPSANSLATDFSRMIPNRTDVAVFKERGWTTLNFAIIGNETRYHSAGDTLAALDPRSVQHMGDAALAVASDIAAGNSPGIAGERIYTDILGRTLVTLPAEMGLAILALLLLAFAFFAWRQRPGIGRASAAIALAVVGGAALCFLAQTIIGLARPGEYWRAYPILTGLAVYLTAMLASLAALVWIVRLPRPTQLRTAFWLLFLLFGAALSAAAPGAPIFFLLPPLVALTGMVLERWLPGVGRIAAIIAAALLFLTWAPLLDLAETLLDMDAAWIFAPVAAIILLPALVELSSLVAALPRTTLFAPLGAVVLAAWIINAVAPAYSADRKQKFGIEHVWNANSGKGRWMVVNDGAPLPSGFEGAGPFKAGVKVPYSTRRRWAGAARAAAGTAPTLARASETRVGKGRRLLLVLNSNGAETVTLRAPPGTALLAAITDRSARQFGKGETDEHYAFRCHGRSCDGLRVELLLGNRKPLDLDIIGVKSGLPAAARPLIDARPAYATPQYGPDATIGLRSIRL